MGFNDQFAVLVRFGFWLFSNSGRGLVLRADGRNVEAEAALRAATRVDQALSYRFLNLALGRHTQPLNFRTLVLKTSSFIITSVLHLARSISLSTLAKVLEKICL